MTRAFVLSACCLLLLATVSVVGTSRATPGCAYFLNFDFKACTETTRPNPGQVCETVTVEFYPTGTFHGQTVCTIGVLSVLP